MAVQMSVTRRGFVKGAAVAGAAGVLAGAGFGSWSGLVEDAQAAESVKDDAVSVIPSACRQCYGRCTINGYVKNGVLERIEPIDGFYSEGTVCSKAYSIFDQIYSPLRIVYPMKQVGERGKGQWKRITWDEAWDTIVSEFEDARQNYGGKTLMYNNGTARDQFNIHCLQKLFHDMGSVGGFGVGSICKMGGDFVQKAVVGNPCTWSNWDSTKSNAIIFWGHGLFADGAYTASMVERAKERGAKFIVIDPRYTAASRIADVWVPLRPGTDIAIALCLIRGLLEANGMDEDFVREWTDSGFLVNPDTGRLLKESDVREGGSAMKYFVWDKTSSSLQSWDAEALQWSAEGVVPEIFGTYEAFGLSCQTGLQALADIAKEWTIAKTSEVTWVEPDTLQQLIDTYIECSPGVSISRGQKPDNNNNASGLSQAMNIIMALAGNYEVEGGNWIKATQPFMPYALFHAATPFPPEKVHMLENLDELAFNGPTAKIYGQEWGYPYSAVKILRTFEPFEPRVIWNANSNPVMMLTASKDVQEVLNRIHFHVSADFFLNATTEIADIFLPALMPNEVDRVEFPTNNPGYPANQTVVCRQPFVDPPGECMDEVDMIFELAKRLKVDMHWKDKYDFYDFQLKPAGVKWKEFKESVHRVVIEKVSYGKHKTGGLRMDKRPGFQTSTGKVNIFCDELEAFGNGPLPFYIEQVNSPLTEPALYGEGKGEYPIILITGGRVHQYFHTEYRESERMRVIHPYPMVDINPATAERFGLKEGDWVSIESRYGSCRQVCHITNEVREEMIHAEHGWWYPELSRDEGMHGSWVSNINMVFPPPDEIPYDPATGALPYHMLVKISKSDMPEGIVRSSEEFELFSPRFDESGAASFIDPDNVAAESAARNGGGE